MKGSSSSTGAAILATKMSGETAELTGLVPGRRGNGVDSVTRVATPKVLNQSACCAACALIAVRSAGVGGGRFAAWLTGGALVLEGAWGVHAFANVLGIDVANRLKERRPAGMSDAYLLPQQLGKVLANLANFGNCCNLTASVEEPMRLKNARKKSSGFSSSLSPWNGATCSVDIASVDAAVRGEGGGRVCGGGGTNEVLTGETEGVALNGVGGVLVLIISKSDSVEPGLLMNMGFDVDVVPEDARLSCSVSNSCGSGSGSWGTSMVVDALVNLPLLSLGCEVHCLEPLLSAALSISGT
ncbi:hypothetical protein CVT26_005393 [Gymnopilus dilepis]|uniref:Uncharacterized protein n=1 Tax=Gymnopilus dilepis TaxID=231916 RepID=A0A409WWW6_9AGAR|nr:hypothetical protein CVT26_005393 [Gymnopilus dilepis]